jgi:hypothetical protein
MVLATVMGKVSCLVRWRSWRSDMSWKPAEKQKSSQLPVMGVTVSASM